LPRACLAEGRLAVVQEESSGRTRIPAAEAVATEAVREILEGSEPVSAQTYAGERAAMLQAKAEHEQAALAAAALVEQQQLAAKAAVAEEQRKTAEKSSKPDAFRSADLPDGVRIGSIA